MKIIKKLWILGFFSILIPTTGSNNQMEMEVLYSKLESSSSYDIKQKSEVAPIGPVGPGGGGTLIPFDPPTKPLHETEPKECKDPYSYTYFGGYDNFYKELKKL